MKKITLESLQSNFETLKHDLKIRGIPVKKVKEYWRLLKAISRAKNPTVIHSETASPTVKKINSPSETASPTVKNVNSSFENSPSIEKNLKLKEETSLPSKNLTVAEKSSSLSSLIDNVTFEELFSTERALIVHSKHLIKCLQGAGRKVSNSIRHQQLGLEIWTVRKIMNLKKNEFSLTNVTIPSDQNSISDPSSKSSKVLALVEKMIVRDNLKKKSH